MTIDILPDVALLEIFDFYVDEKKLQVWHTLVHVCQKWRYIVLGSSRRLNLRLLCKAGTPVTETLDVWPPLPIVVLDEGHEKWGVGNITAALERNDRIRRVSLFGVSISQFERLLAVMQQPFPELTVLTVLALQFWRSDKTMPVIPTSFLGGSAPQLRMLTLHSVPFPELPNLLSSATHLVYLGLLGIPHSGYISPKEMVACLSALTELKTLIIEFESTQSRSDGNRSPRPQTRALLPALTELQFYGAIEYVEDLVARIDTPLLDKLTISCFRQLVSHATQLTEFIRRTPKFKARDEERGSLYELDPMETLWVSLP